MSDAPAEHTDKHVVLVSRQWANPNIAISVTAAGIGIGMALDDFVDALLAEVGSPATILTRAQLAERVKLAATRVVTGMKAETARIV